MQQLQLSKHKLALANIHSREPCSLISSHVQEDFQAFVLNGWVALRQKALLILPIHLYSSTAGLQEWVCKRIFLALEYEAFLVPSMPLSAITHKQLYYYPLYYCLHWVSPVTLDTAIPCWWCSSQCAPQWPYVKTFFYSQAPNRKMPFSPLIYSSVLNWRDKTIITWSVIRDEKEDWVVTFALT